MNTTNTFARSSSTASSPGLTQSPPMSNSSSSPPQPFTPPRQPRPRYPDLGRVPLHRRGTSQKYERLEDLLREAGYKETRVFTPESDRLESQKHSNGASHSNARRQGVGASVVEFLTGLVTGGIGATSQPTHPSSADKNPDRQSRSPQTQSPSSPLGNRPSQYRQTSYSGESSEPRTPPMASSLESLDDPTPKALRKYPNQPSTRLPSRPTTPGTNASAAHPTHYNFHQHHAPLATQHRLSAAQRSLQKQASRTSVRTHTNISSSSAINPASDQGTIPSVILNDNTDSFLRAARQPSSSRAGAYLRHMVSTPAINDPPRPNSTPARTQPSRRRSLPEDSDATDAESTTTIQPPLPRNWLDNVARALLNATIPSPSSPPSPTEPTYKTNLPSSSSVFLHPNHHQRILRPTRSSLSQTTLARSGKLTTRRSALTDQTNTSIHSVLSPPALFARLERGRAPSSPRVLKAQVVCRSAPGSRASSLVRQNSPGIQGGGQRTTKGDRSASGASKPDQKQKYSGTNVAGRGRGNRRNSKKQGDKTCVPSLARTRIEGDAWYIASSALPRRNHNHPNKRPKSKDKLRANYLSDGDYMYDRPCSTEDDEDSFASDNDEDDDDSELDLARMLTHPKRQNSIRSLRKHLHLQLTSPPITDALPSTAAVKSQPKSRKGSGGRPSSAVQTRLGGMEEETGGTFDSGDQWRRGGLNSRKVSGHEEEFDGFPWLRGSGSNGGSQKSAPTRVRSPDPWNNTPSTR